MAKKLTFVTGNKHKFEEISELLSKQVPEYSLIQSNKELTEIQANTLEEVAIYKVKSVLDKIDPPYFIEDAGFFVDDVLNGFPGVYSSYVMKSIGNEAILKLLADSKHRNAHFESVIVYIDENRKIYSFKGINQGKVSLSARGDSGFGFDPIFISDESKGKTFAELSIEEKNAISHRRRAILKLISFLVDKKEF